MRIYASLCQFLPILAPFCGFRTDFGAFFHKTEDCRGPPGLAMTFTFSGSAVSTSFAVSLAKQTQSKPILLVIGQGHVAGAEGVVPGELHNDRGDDQYDDGQPHRSVLADDEADGDDVERQLPDDSDGDVEGVSR